MHPSRPASLQRTLHPTHLSEVAARVPHESAGVNAGPCSAADDPLALRSPGEVLDGSTEPEHLDLHLVFRVVPRPDADLFCGRWRKQKTETTVVRYTSSEVQQQSSTLYYTSSSEMQQQITIAG